MHECGHGLYEHGVVAVARAHAALPRRLARRCTSRRAGMWENLVGRSRPFWRPLLPARSRRRSPSRSATSTPERFYRAINRVQPSLIRVEADEATYNLHIILRFELEQEILAGTLDLKDLPEAWNARFERVPRHPRARRRARRAPGRALVGRRLRLLPDLLARQHRLGADLGEGARATARPDRPVRAGRVRAAARVAAEHLYRSAASSRRRRRSSASSAAPIDAAPYVRYLKDKLGALTAA